MSKIILTGGTAYIGSRLCKHLVEIGHNVGIIKRSSSDLKLITSIYKNITCFNFDGNYKSIFDAINTFKPDLIIHLASYQIYEHYSDEIDDILESNIILGAYIIEAQKNLKVKYLINTATYWQNYNSELYNPVSLYAACKQAFIDIIMYYTEKKYIKVITLKLYDTYGPNDPRKKILFHINSAIINQEKLNMTPGEQMINIVHIDDVIHAYLISINRLLNNKGDYYEEYDVKFPSEIKLQDLVSQYLAIVKSDIKINWGGISYKDREIMYPYDNGKLLPGWTPKISLEEGFQVLANEIK